MPLGISKRGQKMDTKYSVAAMAIKEAGSLKKRERIVAVMIRRMETAV